MANLDLNSWLTGFALGLCGKPLPFAKKTPIGYSYNGVVLPKLPEWDREVYPYAYITVGNGDTSNYTLFLSDVKCEVRYDSIFGYIYLSQPSTGNYVQHHYNQGEDGFVYGISGTGGTGNTVLWCNNDVMLKKGTVLNPTTELFMTASEPVPVHSNSVIQHFLYNNRALPGIPILPPEVRQIYPYATMLDFPENSRIDLLLTSHAFEKSSILVSDTGGIRYSIGYDSDIWMCEGAFTVVSSVGYAEKAYIWSNYDVLDKTDGSIYFTASEPVPVCE